MNLAAGEAREERPAGEGLTVSRIASFSDAIFAVAITLLILNINLPIIPKGQVSQELGPAVKELVPHFWSFVLSFAVIGVYWMSHHGIFRYIKSSTRSFLWLNLAFMMSIVFLPFSTSMLGQYGSDRLAVMFYAGNLTLTGSLMGLLWWYATSGHRLVSKDLSSEMRKHIMLATLLPASIFFISIFVALGSASAAKYLWLAIIPAEILHHSHAWLSGKRTA